MTLAEYRAVWSSKASLRAIYADMYDRMAARCVAGRTIEIGGGVGNFKARLPQTIATDIQFAPWLDCVADAQQLPFAAESASNLVMVDVLHHIEYPTTFFREAARVLRRGGRLVMVEPAITFGSSGFYRLLHHEPVVMSADALRDGTPDPHRDPYASNQAIPTLIATCDRARFHGLFPGLDLVAVDWFSFAVYPLSGGFQPWCLVPERWVKPLLRCERMFERGLGRWLAFRMMLTVEKR